MILKTIAFREALLRITNDDYLHHDKTKSRTKKASVKEEEFLNSMRFQGLVTYDIAWARRDWKYLDLRKICELAVSFGVDMIDFRLIFSLDLIFSLILGFFVGFSWIKISFFFFFLTAAQQVLESPIL
jgi:hypothetical protein